MRLNISDARVLEDNADSFSGSPSRDDPPLFALAKKRCCVRHLTAFSLNIHEESSALGDLRIPLAKVF